MPFSRVLGGLSAAGMVLLGDFVFSQVWASQAIISKGVDDLWAAMVDPNTRVGAEFLDARRTQTPVRRSTGSCWHLSG